MTVVVEGEETPLVVEFGDTAPGASALYARTPPSPRVFTVASYVESSFDKKPFDLRDRDLLHVKRGDVRVLEVTGPEGDYALARSDEAGLPSLSGDKFLLIMWLRSPVVASPRVGTAAAVSGS